MSTHNTVAIRLDLPADVYNKLEMWGEDELHGMAPLEIMESVAEKMAGSAGLRVQVGMRLKPRKSAHIRNGRRRELPK